MAQELYILRDTPTAGSNVLDSPKTSISDFTLSISHMGDNKISAKFYYPSIINFTLNEYVIYEKEGEYAAEDPNATEKYYLITPPTWKKDNKSLMLEYTCDFVSKAEILKYVSMIDSFEAAGDGTTPTKPSLFQTEYSFFGGVEEYFINIKSSMIAEFGYEMIAGVKQPKGFTMRLLLTPYDELLVEQLGYWQEGDDMTITVSNTNVFDALKDIFEKFKVPFFINNTEIVVGGTRNYIDHKFRYGRGKGLYELNKSILNDNIITKIRGVGSEKNLPFDYLQEQKKAAGLANLPMSNLMPKVYRDSLIAASATSNPSAVKDYYISEPQYDASFPRLSFEKFDDIYPTIKEAEYNSNRIDIINGVYFESSAVELENSTVLKGDSQEYAYPRFWIKIPPLGFNLNEHLNEKDKLVLSPTTGNCGGCRFNVLSIGSKGSNWQPYTVNNYYEKNLFILPRFDFYKYVPPRWDDIMAGFNDLFKLSNSIDIQAACEISYGFYGNYKVVLAGRDVTSNISVKIKIHLIKNGDVYATLYDNDVDGTAIYISTGGERVRTFSKTESISIPAEDANGFFHIRSEITYTKNGNNISGDMVNVIIKESNILVEYNNTQRESSDTTEEGQWLYVQKDLETYNQIMPYPIKALPPATKDWSVYNSPALWESRDIPTYKAPVGLVPEIGDEYVFLGISLPEIYITNAEKRLEDTLIKILEDNNQYKYKYNCSFDEKMLIENPSVNAELKIGSIMKIYESVNPSELVDEGDFEEMVVNTITLKYSADKIVPTQIGG